MRSSAAATWPISSNFVRNLRGRMRRKAAHWPGASTSRAARTDLDACAPSTRPTPRRITALRVPPTTTTARARCASSTASRVPALILAAEDDPFVPPEQFARPEVAGNPHVRGGRSRATAATAGSSASPSRPRRLLGRAGRGGVPRRRRCGRSRGREPSFVLSPSSLARSGVPSPSSLSVVPASALDSESSRACANSGPFPSSSCLK